MEHDPSLSGGIVKWRVASEGQQQFTLIVLNLTVVCKLT